MSINDMKTKLEPGRELDARVAEVLGWTAERLAAAKEFEDEYEEDFNIYGRAYWLTQLQLEDISIPCYSTTGDGMLLMLAWLRNEVDEVDIVCLYDETIVKLIIDSEVCNEASAPTICHAVSLALLEYAEKEDAT